MVLGNCLLGMVALCHYCYDLCKVEANMTVGFRYLLVQHKEQTIYPVSLAMWHIWCSNKLSLRISIFSRVFIYSINCIYFFLHHMFEISDKLVHDFRNVIIFTYSFKENFIWYQHFFAYFPEFLLNSTTLQRVFWVWSKILWFESESSIYIIGQRFRRHSLYLD